MERSEIEDALVYAGSLSGKTRVANNSFTSSSAAYGVIRLVDPSGTLCAGRALWGAGHALEHGLLTTRSLL